MIKNAVENKVTRLRPQGGASCFYSQTRIGADAKWKSFGEKIDEMGEDIRASTGSLDLRQLKKFALWGRVCSVLGYATAWTIPNPVSALLIGVGNYARWSLVFHQISHGAMDRVPGVPARYTSKKFALGVSRLWDWLDWIEPEHWRVEHNQMHHYHLGTDADPDVVSRNTRVIRTLNAPKFVRYFLALTTIGLWKPLYYAPNTLVESRFHRGLSKSNRITWQTWNPFREEGRQLWLKSLLPYAIVRFAILPALFFPLGKLAMIAVLVNSVFGELVANFYSFAMIGPNHTGDDVYAFGDSAKGRSDFYLRQIVGSVNYPGGSDVRDFIYGGMNYQIEHHLWPTASLLQCRRMQPRLKRLCLEYGVPYKESAMLPRLAKTIRTMAGECAPLEAPALSISSTPRERQLGVAD